MIHPLEAAAGQVFLHESDTVKLMSARLWYSRISHQRTDAKAAAAALYRLTNSP